MEAFADRLLLCISKGFGVPNGVPKEESAAEALRSAVKDVRGVMPGDPIPGLSRP